MPVDDLLRVVPQLISRIDSLETDLKQTKLTMGNAIVKLVKKVKKLEGILKRRNVVLSDSEEEEPEAQGRKSQDDPLDSLIQGLVTPSTTKVNALGEEQGRRYREEGDKERIGSLKLGIFKKEVNTAEGVNTGSIKLSTVSDHVVLAVNKEASLAEAIRSWILTKKEEKRFGEELQTKTMKRLKDDEAKDAEPTKKFGKRRKQMARKGLHTDRDKDDFEGSDEVSEQDDSITCTKTPINPVPVAMKSPSIATR
ncbi:hypothetical protein Tco_1352339 [Tanacetum coccineum]